jgi:ArsR family transcriptional regulator
LKWPGASGPSALLGLVCWMHRSDVDDSTLIELCRALGDPVRLAIVNELRDGTRCACALAEVVSVSPSLLSHHLKTLRDVGLITGERRGRWIDYSLAPSVLERLSDSLMADRAGASRATKVEVSASWACSSVS